MRLLADENIPRVLVKKLRERGADVLWLPETVYRSIDNSKVIDLANELGRVVLTRDRDFTLQTLFLRARHGVIYLSEPITKENVDKLVTNILKAVELLRSGKRLAVVS